MLTAINNAMAINKKVSEIYKFFVSVYIFFNKTRWNSFCFFVVRFSFRVYNYYQLS